MQAEGEAGLRERLGVEEDRWREACRLARMRGQLSLAKSALASYKRAAVDKRLLPVVLKLTITLAVLSRLLFLLRRPLLPLGLLAISYGVAPDATRFALALVSRYLLSLVKSSAALGRDLAATRGLLGSGGEEEDVLPSDVPAVRK